MGIGSAELVAGLKGRMRKRNGLTDAVVFGRGGVAPWEGGEAEESVGRG